ncbi:hypothetical protein CEUSTIGMA_g9649.t1 [Chlamydomonas eustigma]|uniref:RPAP1 C-terminal domain-containing protein n=1 Tax=Chlamydomonas eustigma TaxID=1157962 RepID=A0A250XGL4_9CHLO|nr:hypothetical protein CEUSTIGMA_g9649.t1 [Chlamydomonas eustigma]|eukprot:GAX82221.1 hypothetical protein CEUSTIGMA_g9649.t1 [Chlamydomonas eustigma]
MFKRPTFQSGEDDDEDDLLRMQEEFLSKKATGSAKVTRIQPRPPTSADEAGVDKRRDPGQAAGSDDLGPSRSGMVVTEPLQEGHNSIIPNLAGIMGDVLERNVSAAVVRETRSSTGPMSSAAFPDASHRHKSKFSLSRKPAPTSSVQTSSTVPTSAPTASLSSTTTPSAMVAESTTTSAAGASVLARSLQTPISGGVDMKSISSETTEMLNSMGPEGVAAALEEVSSRLSVETLQFLRARGAKKAAATAGSAGQVPPGPAAAGHVAGYSSSSAPSPAKVSAAEEHGCMVAERSGAQANKAVLEAGSTKKTGYDESNASSLSSTAGAAAATTAAGEGMKMISKQHPNPQEDDSILEDGGKWLVADPRLEARLRFDLHAVVLSIQPEHDKITQEQVLQRDAMRADEGLVPQGYTLTEILLLARSSMPNQRAMAMRMLCDVLKSARPSRCTLLHPTRVPISETAVQSSHAEGTKRSLPVPESSDNATPSQSKMPSAVHPPLWHDVWQYAVHDLAVAPHIRLALDDDSAPVVAAAVSALASLVCPSDSDIVEEEMADCCPRTGWPCVRGSYLSRPNAAGVWESQSLQPVAPTTPTVAPGMEEPQTPEDVAAVDPVAGLMQMQLLQRLRYLLEVVQHQGATLPIISIFTAIGRMGAGHAECIVRCPRLLDVLKAMLMPSCFMMEDDGDKGKVVELPTADVPSHTTDATSLSPDAGQHICIIKEVGPGSSSTSKQVGPGPASTSKQVSLPSAQDPDCTARQAPLLLLLRTLCQSSKLAAQLVRSAGVMPLVQAHLLMGCNTLAQATHSRRSSSEVISAAIKNGHTLLIKRTISRLLVQQQLCVIEALRLWRVCCHQGLAGLPALEDVFTSVCMLLHPPVGLPGLPSDLTYLPQAEAAGDAWTSDEDDEEHAAAGAAATRQLPVSTQPCQLPPSASTHIKGMSAAMRWSLCREALLLATSFLNQALAVQSGDRSLGRPLMLPGTAAALAQDAMQWLRPDWLRLVAVTLVEHDDQQEQLDVRGIPLSGSSGIHAALLLPLSFSASSCLAAALQFQADYWSSLKNSSPAVFGQVRSAVSASGLVQLDKMMGPSASTLPMTAFDALCAQLLSKASKMTQEGGGLQLGYALTCLFKEVVEKGADSQNKQSELSEVSASAVLLSILSLVKAISHLGSNKTNPGEGISFSPQTGEGISFSSQQGTQCYDHVTTMVCKASARGVMRHTQASAPVLSQGRHLRPWHGAMMQRSQHILRLFLCSASLASPPSHLREASVGKEGSGHPLCQEDVLISENSRKQELQLPVASIHEASSSELPTLVSHALLPSQAISTYHSTENISFRARTAQDSSSSQQHHTARADAGPPRRSRVRKVGSKLWKGLRVVGSRAVRSINVMIQGLVTGGCGILWGGLQSSAVFVYRSALCLVASAMNILGGAKTTSMGLFKGLMHMARGAIRGLSSTAYWSFQGFIQTLNQGILRGLETLAGGVLISVAAMSNSFLSGMGTVGVAMSAGLTQAAGGACNAIEGVGSALGCVLEGVFGCTGVGVRTMLLSLAQGLEILSGRDCLVEPLTGVRRGDSDILAEHDENDDEGLAQHPGSAHHSQQQQTVHFAELLSLPAPSGTTSYDGRGHIGTSTGLQSRQAASSGMIMEPRTGSTVVHSSVDTSIIDATLSVLVMSAPAAENQCLSALSLAMHHPTTRSLLQSSLHYLSHTLPARNPVLAAAAAATSPSTLLSPSSTVPYPCPAADSASNHNISNLLLNSYAASWLSMLNVSKAAANSGQDRLGLDASTSPSSYLTSTFWDDGGEGSSSCASRLPLPGTWPLMEAHLLPDQHQLPAGPALLLNLGLHLSSSTYYSNTAPNPASRLKWAVHMAYLFDSNQLLAQGEEGACPGGGMMTGALGHPWRDPWVRWSLAGLVQQICIDSCTQQVTLLGHTWCTASMADRLAQLFTSATFGDPLLGCLLAQLLMHACSGPVHLSVVNALIEAHSLHLLPSVSSCIGTASQYHGCWLGKPESSHPKPRKPLDPRVVATWLSALSQGQLDRAMQVGSVTFEVAINCLGTALFAYLATGLAAVETHEHSAAVSKKLSAAQELLEDVNQGGREPVPKSTRMALKSDNRAVAALRRAQLAKSMFQQIDVQILKKLLLAVQERGTPLREQCSYLATVFERTNTSLIEKLKQVMIELNMV